MSYIRPEVAQAAMRWREALVGGAAILLGAYWLLAGRGIMPWLGGIIAVIGVLLVVTGIQRGRFRLGSGGAGVVQVDERQVSYFGPLSGGIVPMGALTRIELDPTGQPMHWVLYHSAGGPLHIPLDAEGAETLFDVFASLPEMRTEAMLALLEDPPQAPVSVWVARGSRLH